MSDRPHREVLCPATAKRFIIVSDALCYLSPKKINVQTSWLN